jgi:hypothetical protein
LLLSSSYPPLQIVESGSAVRKLIEFSFELALKKEVGKRAPYLIVSDLLDGQSIEKAEKLWDLIDSSVDLFTSPELMKTGEHIDL